ncbi:AT-rich interactive domain-containing protein 3 isoform X1 [Raphanus sativus]|uniref:AT-rich interactive domain-containing protein 3 isoform X1 n=1 Tax=Raphanus sativus TaxID=3726 RepID=A0A6J0K198_RAPSA|nr:AT-rich interactive domain-containing protein 3 isoform X1 [Raphanus sativus]
MENITEMETEQQSIDTATETDKQIETEQQSIGNAMGTDDKNPKETVGEDGSESEHKDSPSPMVTEEATSHASTLEKATNDDDPRKIDDEKNSQLETTPSPEEDTSHASTLEKAEDDLSKIGDEKNSQLEANRRPSPPPSGVIDPEEGFIKPTVEDTLEQNIASNKVSSDVLRDDRDSVMIDEDIAVVHEETTTVPHSKLSEDKRSPRHHANTVMEQVKPAEEYDMTSSGDHHTEITVTPDTKLSEDIGSPFHQADTVMEQDKTAEGDDMISSGDLTDFPVLPDTKIPEEKGSPLHHADTAMEQDKTAEEHDMISSGEREEFPIIPDSKLSEDKGSPLHHADTVTEQDKTAEEHDIISSGEHKEFLVIPDTKVFEEDNDKIDEGEASNMNLADDGSGPIDHAHGTTMEVEKGPEVPGPETVSNLEDDKPSEPLVETSVNVEKEPDMPDTEHFTENYKLSDVLAAGVSGDSDKGLSVLPATQISSEHNEGVATLEAEPIEDMELDVPDSKLVTDADIDSTNNNDVNVDFCNAEKEDYSVPERSDADNENASVRREPGPPCVVSSDTKPEVGVTGGLNNGVHKVCQPPSGLDGTLSAKRSFLLDDTSDGNESGTEEDQSAFMKELYHFFRERSMDFKPPKFYGEGLNCLKLWRAVIRLGGYDKVTGCKLWRQVGESFRPPKTCTTVSWTFRGFYEKALLEYERHKVMMGELHIPLAMEPEPMNIDNQASGSGRARRDSAARAMQGWNSQRLNGNGEVNDPSVKDKNLVLHQKREKQIGNTPGLLKRKRPSSTEHAIQVSRPMLDVTVVDVGPPADWVKINVQRTEDCFEVYALVPGLVREEVRVQSDPAGRLVISGEPENPMNPWGATPFKKVVSLPTRIDPHHTSAVVTLNGQLFVRVPLEQSD